jgi:hypothetical protein
VADDAESVLVNFWYAQPVGHAVEALHYCLGYHRADPARHVSLMLERDFPLRLKNIGGSLWLRKARAGEPPP